MWKGDNMAPGSVIGPGWLRRGGGPLGGVAKGDLQDLRETSVP